MSKVYFASTVRTMASYSSATDAKSMLSSMGPRWRQTGTYINCKDNLLVSAGPEMGTGLSVYGRPLEEFDLNM